MPTGVPADPRQQKITRFLSAPLSPAKEHGRFAFADSHKPSDYVKVSCLHFTWRFLFVFGKGRVFGKWSRGESHGIQFQVLCHLVVSTCTYRCLHLMVKWFHLYFLTFLNILRVILSFRLQGNLRVNFNTLTDLNVFLGGEDNSQ